MEGDVVEKENFFSELDNIVWFLLEFNLEDVNIVNL